MIKFVHTADIHLGLELKNVPFSKEIAEERRNALWNTFERIVDYSIEIESDFLFIAGDLYEEKYFTIGDIKRVRDILAKAKEINILISAGNHDYLHNNSIYRQIEWSENVYIFGSNSIEKKEFKELDTVVYGYSWDTIEKTDDSIFNDLKIDSEYSNKIMMIHGDAISDSNYLPLNINRLKKLDMDYIALGHIHKPEKIENNIIYPGCPEPTNFGETGDRGIVVGRIEDKLTTEFKVFSERSFIEKEIDIDENMSYMDIKNIFDSIEDQNKNFFRIYLNGYIQNDMDKNSLFKDLESNFYFLQIIDNTIPDYDLVSLEKDYKEGIIGNFIREMKSKDLDNPIVKKALYYGLDALLREGIQ